MELHKQKKMFEVVFVAADDDLNHEQQLFDLHFKDMPWLAIPFSDKDARKYCKDSLHDPTKYGRVSCFIIQTNGYILQDWPAVFTIYGAKAFPFTSERLEELEHQNLSFFTDPPSMKELLGDSVMSPDGKEVPSASLDNKVVGLLFLVDYHVINVLLSAWEKLESRHGDFVIVVVPPPRTTTNNSYNERCDSLPWPVLSDRSRCQKLWWIYHPPRFQGFLDNAEQHPGVLVTIGPNHNRFCSYYAADILLKFGVEAYPFTFERAAELEKKKLENLKLGSLLGTEQLVCGADRKKVTASELSGKEVIVFVSWNSLVREGRMAEKLDVTLEMCSECPGWRVLRDGCRIGEVFTEGGEFPKIEYPIIYISIDGATDEKYTRKDPMIISVSESVFRSCVSSGIIKPGDPPQIALFGKDGRLASRICWDELGEDKMQETFSRNGDIISQLRDTYRSRDLVGWWLLQSDRLLTEIDYI